MKKRRGSRRANSIGVWTGNILLEVIALITFVLAICLVTDRQAPSSQTSMGSSEIGTAVWGFFSDQIDRRVNSAS